MSHDREEAWQQPSLEVRYDMEYLDRLPLIVRSDRYLVHNRVRPVQLEQGLNGSRFWLQKSDQNLESCDCGWAPWLGLHFRVRPRQAP